MSVYRFVIRSLDEANSGMSFNVMAPSHDLAIGKIVHALHHIEGYHPLSKRCDAMACGGLFTLPSGRQTELWLSRWNVVDAKAVCYEPVERVVHYEKPEDRREGWPTEGTVIPQKLNPESGEIMFIKNRAYGPCGLPGVVWDEHADFRADEGLQGGWLCEHHAKIGDTRRRITLAEIEEAAARRDGGD